MSEFKGTPGPWKAVCEEYGNAQTGDRGISCYLCGPDARPLPFYAGQNMVKSEVVLGNAMLASAAPDLLAACRLALEVIDDLYGQQAMPDDSHLADVDAIRAAITKALGQ